MKNTTFKIIGMHCDACKKIIEKRANQIVGVTGSNVNLQSKTIEIISATEITLLDLQTALKGLEYHAKA